MAPFVVGFGGSFLFWSGIIPVAANFLLGAIHPRPGLPEFMAGLTGLYVLAGVAAFFLTLVIKLWDAVAT